MIPSSVMPPDDQRKAIIPLWLTALVVGGVVGLVAWRMLCA